MKKLNKLGLIALIAVLAVALSITACKANVGTSSVVVVTSVTLDKPTAEVEVGNTVTLKATVLPENATDKSITWTSDKTDIATVDAKGVVTGVKAGTAKITVKTKDGGKTASCDVTVKSTTPPPVPEGFVSVTPPGTGIVGETGTPAGSDDYYKGVFIEGRTVKLTPYAIAEKEVTYKLWNEVYRWATLADGGTAGEPGKPAEAYTFANNGTCGNNGLSDGSVVSDGSENEPVTSVSWRDCIVWCNAYTEMKTGNTDSCVYRVSKTDPTIIKSSLYSNASQVDNVYADMSKKGFRLPTEAEWEYAARYKNDNTLTSLNYLSGATKDYTNAEACKAVAWYATNSESKTHKCGTRQANDLGLYDMSGNVWEWCFDGLDGYDELGTGEAQDPQGSASGSYRVLRGGSWGNNAGNCVVGYRVYYAPGYRLNRLGFRLAWRP